ncbi:hypothetical protein ACRS6Y_13235 [Bacillus cytotoxicus]|uniref:hypothetical protein n=1 Tax=Bacillus cytotoxicus TaxID=580165 RepID=UPI000661415E|nr:hypothetical protein [Bacillus cytotoxicus]AWC30443.1 hypothetical protein CG483_020330 [Bacillus cytotoxicus]AWC34492.1 hypothetical protein CG482_020330 [Bacillus cytotoxicus]AWC38489.1 hypothetical protein CG481_020170 [Bacillus cytotoxicus]AWC42583.1 hypothetical protein CG480_020350 [Bacillus cytotoxicus]AWC46457.1 hypothetical protein CG479_019465 [Bacillus cytotoxicus]
MKWLTIVGITVCVLVIALYEWPKMNHDQKKEKVAFITLTAIGYLLAILLLFFPDMLGPTQMIEKLFKPLGKMLEKK